MTEGLAALFVLFVFLGAVPTLVSLAQFLLVGWHGRRNHLPRCADYTPRVAFILPAWNEAEVIGASIDALMRLDYPAGGWRIYVVDDASTDHTPAVMQEKMAQYPGSVFHLRREAGGQGKSHTLNHGLRTVLAEDWAEAVMIMDADVLFEPLTLRRMTRHLADPEVGAVTAYVKEGSQPGNPITRFIAFEYITGQAAARRAQNLLGALACMAGGAQLHSRINIEALGGAIDTRSLAEDTFTTFNTQLAGRLTLFEGNAVVWAEEPDSLAVLWKQRLRWARGNLQITRAFRDLWFRPSRHPKLGGAAFGLIWFSIVLMPVCLLLAGIGIVGLHLLEPQWAWLGFHWLWGTHIAVYLFVTLFALAIDPDTGRRTWLEALLFPGLISLAIMASFFLPPGMTAADGLRGHPAATLFVLSWVGLSTPAAWLVYRIERLGAPAWLRDLLLMLVGYGPLMSAVSFAAMVAEFRHAEARWDKTVKSGKARMSR